MAGTIIVNNAQTDASNVFTIKTATGDNMLQIGTGGLASSSITTAMLQDNSVTAAKIAPGTIVDSDIADNAVTTAKIAATAVTPAKLATNAVTTGKIANDAVTTDKTNLISTSSVPSLEAKGTSGSTSGYIQLNCSENSHGIKLLGPPHSAAANYTLTLPNNDGNASQFLQTNGSGVTSWADVASTPESLVKSFTLTSGKTVTAGKMVSIATNGEVGTLPAVNTLGTYRATSNTHQYGGINSIEDSSGGISWNGSRGISFSGTASYNAALRGYSGSQGSRVVTVSGHAFSTSATTVDGSTTVTVPIPNSAGPASLDGATSAHPYDGAWQVFCYPLSDTSFMVTTASGSGNAATPLGNQSSWNFNYSATVVTVDASGNCTKGTTVAQQITSSTMGGGVTWVRSAQRRLSNNTFIMMVSFSDTFYLSYESTYALKRVIKWTGGTGVQMNKSNFASSLGELDSIHVNAGCVRTSGNKIVWTHAQGTRMISIADSDGGLGNIASVTSVAIADIPVVSPGIARVGDQYDPGFRLPLDETKLYWSGYNYTGDNFRVIVGVSISSAGVATLDIGTFSTNNTDAATVDNPEFGTIMGTGTAVNAIAGFRTIGGKLFVNSLSLNSVGRIIEGNLGLQVNGSAAQDRSAIRWTGSKWLLFVRESNSLSANQVTVDMTVGAQSTLPINFIGFPVATDSSTPTNIVVQGVASGFSSLTPGQTYFENNIHDGTVTLDVTSGVKVGKAISSTEMLINRTL